ncbi:hypothetical protein VNO78_08029 [Psophocarpus tetragonolobus]|uniref:Uncharacterized protein n=1 Tax=Psophocarpus tetragonolobus TaxID=3891 RepID=A0AAN9XSH1_PSOTE
MSSGVTSSSFGASRSVVVCKCSSGGILLMSWSLGTTSLQNFSLFHHLLNVWALLASGLISISPIITLGSLLYRFVALPTCFGGADVDPITYFQSICIHSLFGSFLALSCT